MNIERLVKTAKRIGEFFSTMPDHAVALEGIANHIRKFWAPRMRVQFGLHIAQTNGAGLLPVVKQALTSHAAVLLAA